MGNIKLSIEKNKDPFLYSCRIENLFISEFMPEAPGEYVKVFLLGLMYAQYDEEMDSRKLAIRLGLSEDEVEEAWIYWASRGVIRRRAEIDEKGRGQTRIEFISQITKLYGRASDAEDNAAADAAEAPKEDQGREPDEMPIYVSIDDMDYDGIAEERMTDKALQEIFRKYKQCAEAAGRTVSRQDTNKIADAVRVYGIKPEIFGFAIDYCADLGKDSIDYIFKVALRWTEDGCETVEDAKVLLEKHSKRNSWYSQVFRALGFNRLAAPADREIMDRWFDDMKFDIDEVLDACRAAAGIRDPNLRYVNKVLENRRLEKGGVNTRIASGAEAGEGSLVSRRVLNDYFEHIRNEEKNALEARTREVRGKIPEIEDVFAAERSINARLLAIKPGEGSRMARNELRAERQMTEKKKKDLLDAAGFPEDYLDMRYRCGICRDTGYTDEGMVCSCCRERAEEAYEWIGAGKAKH